VIRRIAGSTMPTRIQQLGLLVLLLLFVIYVLWRVGG